MERNEALQIAKQTREVHMKALIDGMFGRTPELTPADELSRFGYRHGWYRVGEFNFSTDEITGEQYDYTQGGWAYL